MENEELTLEGFLQLHQMEADDNGGRLGGHLEGLVNLLTKGAAVVAKQLSTLLGSIIL